MPSSCSSCSSSASGSLASAAPTRGVSRVLHGALAPLRWLEQLLVLLLLALIRGYQRAISPLLRPSCRFLPSCSEYAALALKKHGLLKGLGKTTWRLCRCQPFCRGGHDEP